MNKKTVVTIVTVGSVLVTVILGLLMVNRIRLNLVNNLTAQYLSHEELVAQETSNLLKAEIKALQDKLYLIAQLPQVKNPTGPNSCNRALQNATDEMQVKVNNLGRVGRDRKFTCSLNIGLIGTDAAPLGKYIEEIFNDPQHKPVLSHAIKIPNLSNYAFALHIPVFDENGQFDGTLGGAIYFDYLQENYLKDITFAGQGYVNIQDDDYTILYHSRTELIGKNFFGDEYQSLIEQNPDVNSLVRAAGEREELGTLRYNFAGEERIATFYPFEIFPGRRWIITVNVPVKEIEETIMGRGVSQYVATIATLLTLGIIIPPAIIFIYLLRYVFRPLDEVTESLQKLSAGDFHQSIEYKGGNDNDEISKLVSSFNQVSNDLGGLYANLNRMIAEKTEALRAETKSNTQLEETVQHRTDELHKTLGELKRFNGVMVERELKIIELKKKINAMQRKGSKPIA